ncbi:MAG: hypothetical protein K2W95_20805 [Candidatus Obscuribacterales bacterium]|nr:hypothetical protein [Candidatus Obscuribacterales bacterium]
MVSSRSECALDADSDFSKAACSIERQASPNNATSLLDLSAGLWKEIETAARQPFGGLRQSLSVGDRVEKLIGSGVLSGLSDIVAHRLPQAPMPSPKTEWTVVLNLTTDFDGNEDGSFNRLKDLESFALKTKGTSLAIVVQAAYRVPPDPPVPYGQGYTPEYRLERHVVRNGSITQVAEGKSNGYGQDLEDLLSYASRNNNSPKMALIMDTHGLGNEGLTGDTGHVTVAEFVKRVQSGLRGSGREKFDLIDFDACLMSQNGVLARMGVIADQVVASAELEPARGISLLPPLELLLTKPETDARTLGRSLVNEARVQGIEFEAKGIEAPIKTVASIELSKYAGFRRALDDFGDKLAALTTDAKVKADLVAVIDKTFRYKGNEYDDMEQADLRDFIQRVVSAIDDGQLPDTDRSLKRSALAVQTKLGDLVDAFYGHREYKQTGGVSVFLPTWQHREPGYVAETQIVSGRILHATDASKFAEVNKNAESRQAFLKHIDDELVRMLPIFLAGGIFSNIAATAHDELFAVSAARQKFASASDDSARRTAFAEINQAAKLLQSSSLFDEMFGKHFKKATNAIDDSFRLQLVDDGTTGWSRFQNSVRHPRSK